MAAYSNSAPVIIKRKKVVAERGHHGGAWKVAYADFVTAMMAFFLLMWLLNSTSEQQREGIADFFNPMVAPQRVSGGGEGPFGGRDIFSDQILAEQGSGATTMLPPDDAAPPTQGDLAIEQKVLAELDAKLKAIGGESMTMERLMRHIVTRLTDEGLVIEVFDLPDSPLFQEGTSVPRPVLRELAAVVARVFNLSSNTIGTHGYVFSYPITLNDNPAWRLSVERAQAARGLLEQVGVNGLRMQRVTGYSDRKPAVEDVTSVRNNRLEIILLRQGR